LIDIPDASVAVKWFVREREPGLAAADEVRRRILMQPQDFAVPSLFIYEVQAVLCRRVRSAADVVTDVRGLWALAIPIVQPDATLLDLATDIAFTYRLTAYDAAYAALAQHLRGRWITFDEAAYRRVASLKLARLLPLT
jgi:predicted nucleic acid-binding protein